LETEDYVIQTCYDVSPIKWHLAHTSWFFEEFILKRFVKNYSLFHELYSYLFNSYYNSIGDRVMKDLRGLLSRPTVNDIIVYRNHINEQIDNLFSGNSISEQNELNALLEIGINHEQQHQELMFYDIKHIFYINPTKPIYLEKQSVYWPDLQNKMIEFDGGLLEFGHAGSSFAFDNEYPRHRAYLNPFAIQNRLVTNGDFLQFIDAKGYNSHEFWLADGWEHKNQNNWQSPMYWENRDNEWFEWQLNGYEKLNLNRPVSHLSFYEAYAYAKWSGKRLPTEYEFEHVAKSNRVELSGYFCERLIKSDSVEIDTSAEINQLNGYNWQWTRSSYSPYPGYKQSSGAIGEYNGKFMSGQMVLRGGSSATAKSHYRPGYRNFFQPEKRWLINGIRLAEDL
ncbi:MAG: ergothioneine biosynthesis protein EgtB, partial [Calditrichaeota bacterium]|nr:ergothioneine biosynthesis protein EgtB [Calditrichota bacterium]